MKSFVLKITTRERCQGGFLQFLRCTHKCLQSVSTIMLTDVICGVCGEDACPDDIILINDPLLAIGCRKFKMFIQFQKLTKLTSVDGAINFSKLNSYRSCVNKLFDVWFEVTFV